MIIEKIELENFLCYSGKAEDNVMEFTEGINVIIGDNGYGKSKLYDAFYWVLYDQIFTTENKSFQNTKAVKSKIISDSAKYQAKDGKVSAFVRITFHNLERDNVYILERKYSVNIKNGNIIESNDSEFTIMQKELSYLNAKMVTDEEEKKNIVKKILPPQVKDYLWFQGEQVESIIDFNKHDTLTKAINVLSNISRYDDLKNISSASAKAANTEYGRELKRLSKDLGESEKLERQKDILERKIESSHKEEIDLKENLSKAEERCEILISKLPDANKVTEFQQRKKSLIKQLAELNETLNDEQNSFHRKMFRNKWVLKGTEHLHEAYSKRYSAYESKKLKDAADKKASMDLEKEIAIKLQTRLPLNVPEPIYVQKMLEEEWCSVCDREALKDSEPWLKIKELLNNTNGKPKPLEVTSKQNFSDDLKRLYHNGLSLISRIPEIDDDINDTLKKITGINNKIKDINKEIKKLEEDVQKLIEHTSINLEDAEGILAEYSIKSKHARDFSDRLNVVTQSIESDKSKLRGVIDDLKGLVTGEIPAWLVEKKDILNDFETIASTTRDRVFNGLIAFLENESNLHYQNMTSGNRSSRGQIHLRKLPNGNYMPEITDRNGVPLLGSNTSNLILVKLAAIMAIISAKSTSGVVDFYTLITDAPTSVFGEDYTIGFCKTISKVYRQSIIMSKEFYKNQSLRNELLTNPEIKIGKVYMITPSIVETERDDRNNLSTNIESLN